MKLPLVATLAIAIVSIALSSVSAQTPEASQKRVSKWIEQLDSPDFDVREYASQNLVASGAGKVGRSAVR